MSLRLAPWFVALSTVLGASLTVCVAQAQLPTTPEAESAEAGARRHFERALEQYRSGQYSRALGSLKEAIALDPNGKDLFFNLAMVHEKLGQLPEAIAAWQRFEELEPDQAERQRAGLTIARLRGAAVELSEPSPQPTCPEPAPPPAPAPRAPSTLLIGTASVAVAALVVGAVFGGKAWADDVSDERTSTSLSVTQLRERGRRAAREALIADVAFAVAGAAGGTFACVWLLSPSEPARTAGVTLKGYF